MRGAKGIPCVKTSEFKAGDSTLLGGWHYLPDQRTGKVPTVVMPHGFASVKEMYLDKYAELGAQSGHRLTGLRPPLLRRQRRRATAGTRSLDANPRLARRHQFRRDPARDRHRAHRHLRHQNKTRFDAAFAAAYLNFRGVPHTHDRSTYHRIKLRRRR